MRLPPLPLSLNSIFAHLPGKVYSCGSEEYGQCGTGQTGERLEKANRVTFGTLTTLQRVRGLDAIKQIACGTNHTVALAADGNVFTWGFGAYGRLGHKVRMSWNE